MKQSFLSFTHELSGYDFKCKKTNQIIPRFILYWSGLSIYEIEKRFNKVARPTYVPNF